MPKRKTQKNKKANIAIAVLSSTVVILAIALSVLYFSKTGWPRIFNIFQEDTRTYIATYDVSASKNDSVTLSITDDRVAVVSGKGKMKDYADTPEIPWAEYRDKIDSIEIESGVTHIGSYSFTRCGSFTELSVPDGVESIGKHAFSDCKSLQNVSISSSVYSIGECAFYRCEKLSSVKIPISAVCENNAFHINEALKSVIIIKGSYDDYKYAADDCEKHRYPWYETDEITVTFDNGINTIPAYMFYGCTGISTIILSSSPVKSIGSHAFANSSITSCILPEGVQSVGDFAFQNCRNLLNFILPCSVSDLSPSCFSDCVSMESFSFGLPSAVTVIPKQMFFNCYALTDILLPQGISEIQSNAFSNCTSLEKISFSDDTSMEKIGARAFSSCSSLKEIFFPEIKELGTGILSDCTSLLKVIITSEITSIPDGFCSDCGSLQTVVIPKTVETIGRSAFASCKSLQAFSFPSGLTEIGPFAFQYTALREITLGDKIKEIKSCTFRGCSKLERISIGSNVEKIGFSAFSETQISAVYIPDSVTEIAYDAFGHCDRLEFIEVGQGIKRITYNMFYADRSIRQMTFHNPEEKVYIDQKIYTENLAFDETKRIFVS